MAPCNGTLKPWMPITLSDFRLGKEFVEHPLGGGENHRIDGMVLGLGGGLG